MAFADALAVRNSDLYEYKNTAKPLLTLIYQLIERAEEDEEPSENEGTAWASQGYLAAQLGCSESQVSKWVRVFVHDAWLIANAYRDEFGHPRYRYSLPDTALSRLEKRKMKKEGRRYVRKTQAGKRRPQCYKNIAQELLDEEAHASSTRVARAGHEQDTNGAGTGQRPRSPLETPDSAAPQTPQSVTQAYEESPESPPAPSRGVLPLRAGEPARSEGHPLPLRADTGVGGVRSESTSVCAKPADTNPRSLRSSPNSNSQPSGLRPEPSRRDFSSPDPTAHDSASRPPVPPPPAHFSHKWVTLERTDRRTGKTEPYDSCAFCVCGRTSPAAQKLCRPDMDIKEEAARWVESQIQSQGATV